MAIPESPRAPATGALRLLAVGWAALVAVSSGAQPSSFGREFWGCDMEARPGNTVVPFALVAANPGPATASVIVETVDGVLDSATVAAGDAHVFRFDRSRQLAGTQRVPNAYRLVADVPIAAFQWSSYDATVNPTPDSSLLLPVELMGLRHRAVSRPQQGTGNLFDPRFPGSIAIVGLAVDRTTVTLVPSGDTQAGFIPATAAGTPVTFTLGRFEVAQVLTGGAGQDLTGSLVTSDRPVAVFAGAECMNVPAGVRFCDHLQQQVAPEWAWGRSFVAARSEPRAGEPDLWRVVAGTDGTTVTFDPPSVGAPATIDAGSFVEVSAVDDFAVAATEPVQLVQYLVGSDWTAGSDLGDPSEILVVPVEQHAVEAFFHVPSSFDANHAVIVMPAGATADLDGLAVPAASFAPVAASGFMRARVPVPPGNHRVVLSQPGAVSAHGITSYGSYGYPAVTSGHPTGPVRCDAGGPYSLACGETTVVLDGSGSTSPATFAWSALTPGLLLATPDAATTIATVPGPGRFLASLSVIEGDASHSCVAEIEVATGAGVPAELAIGLATEPLHVRELPGVLRLSFEARAGERVNVMAGTIAPAGLVAYDHAPLACWLPVSAGVETYDAPLDAGSSRYYLVSASTCAGEGTRGFRSDGVERPALPSDCGASP